MSSSIKDKNTTQKNKKKKKKIIKNRQRLLFVSFVVLSTILHLIIHNSAIDDDLTKEDVVNVNVDVDSFVENNNNNNNDDIINNNRDDIVDDYHHDEKSRQQKQQQQKNKDKNNNIMTTTNSTTSLYDTITTTTTTTTYNKNNTTSSPPPSSATAAAAAAAAASQQQQQQQDTADTTPPTTVTTVWLNHLHHLWDNISSNPSSSSSSIGLLLEIPSSYKPPKGTNRICSTWNISIDDWWVHNYRWKIVKETPDEYCLEQWQAQTSTATTTTTTNTTARRRLEFKNRIKLYRMLYKNQFFGIEPDTTIDCNKTISKYMWSTGWGADFLNVIDGLGYGLTHGVPFIVNYKKSKPWHYSRDVKECDQPGSLNCYFLNYSKCNSTNVNVVNNTMLDTMNQFLRNNKYIRKILYETNNRYIYEWITRPKTWLRRKVVDFIQPYLSRLPSDKQKKCTVMHVRRGDVVLHGKVSRRYFEIHEYMSALEEDYYRSSSNSRSNATSSSSLITNNNNNNKTKTNKTILLLTDDANAIKEARTLYPYYTWITIDRSRYQGSEGGFEGHFPSNDALKETIVLLGTFRLVQRCTTLIHTHSNLAQLFWGYMLSEHGKKVLKRIEIGSNTNFTFNTKNSITVNISRSEF